MMTATENETAAISNRKAHLAALRTEVRFAPFRDLAAGVITAEHCADEGWPAAGGSGSIVRGRAPEGDASRASGREGT